MKGGCGSHINSVLNVVKTLIPVEVEFFFLFFLSRILKSLYFVYLWRRLFLRHMGIFAPCFF